MNKFPKQLWNVVNDPACDEYISWHDDGSSVLIPCRNSFAKEVLLLYWHFQQRPTSTDGADSTKACSRALNAFDRQLRIYNFKKTDTKNKLVFKHVSLKN